MSSFFSRLLISFLLVLLLVVSWLAVLGLGDKSNEPELAAAISSDIPSKVTEDVYVSLLDVIALSLERIKQGSEESATSTPEVEEVAATDDEYTPPEDLADTIVNIYCQYETSEYRRLVSGTGFLVSDQGAILTNAHVAQYLLLEGGEGIKSATCEVRTGAEANSTYTAKLLYISPSFVIKHAERIASQSQRGNGENDFALLYIADTTSGDKKPSRFAHIPPATDALSKNLRNQTVIVVGYPSEEDRDFEEQVRAIATTTVTEIYTFKEGGMADLFSLSASKLGHQGSSGGPVIDHLGRAIGVITTKDEGTTILNAIATAYIDRKMREETGFDLMSTLQGNLEYRSSLFNETVAPILRELLTEALNKS